MGSPSTASSPLKAAKASNIAHETLVSHWEEGDINDADAEESNAIFTNNEITMLQKELMEAQKESDRERTARLVLEHHCQELQMELDALR
jgi:hypothetical protein